MNTPLRLAAFALAAAVCLQLAAAVRAGTTIDPANHYAYAANLGWVDWCGDTNNGAVIGEYVCSGCLYSANTGWICLGSGAATNSIQYQNNSASDFGVNQDGLGHLTGYAWGANIGWVTFEQTYGQPKINLCTGQFTGYAWSANCGWISLSNAMAVVQTDSIQKGALAPNGLPIAWLLQNFGTTNVNANACPTGKGCTIGQDYLAGTDPNNAADVFKITSFTRNVVDYNQLRWNSKPTRFYAVQGNSDLATTNWSDYGTFTVPGAGSTGFSDSNQTNQFYRLRVYRPLTQ